MSGTVRRRSMTAVETVSDLDVTLPPLPRRTKATLEAVLGALLAIHQPYYERPGTIIEETVCTECKRRWPCNSVRIIIGDWITSASAEKD